MNTYEKQIISLLNTPKEGCHVVLANFFLRQDILCIMFDRYFSMERDNFSTLLDYYIWLIDSLLQLKAFIKLWSVFRYFRPDDLSFPWIQRPACLLSPFHIGDKQIVFSNEDDRTSSQTAAIFSYLLKNSHDLFKLTFAEAHINVIQWNFFTLNEELDAYLIKEKRLLVAVLYMIVCSIMKARIPTIYKENEMDLLFEALRRFAEQEEKSQKDLTEQKLNEIYQIYYTWYATKEWDLQTLKTKIMNKNYIIN